MTLHLPDILGGHPVRWISTYGSKSAVEVPVLGRQLVLDTDLLVEAAPAEVPAGVAGFAIGGRLDAALHHPLADTERRAS